VKSYQHYCSVARALDVVGDRWVLLIVRELLAFGPSRYSDLKRGLPGIATNLLAKRLRTMEAEGLVERHDAPAPIGAGVYQLTRRGLDLEGVLRALTLWGLSTMPGGPSVDDAVQPQWSALLAALTLPGHLPAEGAAEAEVVVAIETGDESAHVVLRPGGYEIARGLGREPDVTLSGSARLVGGVLAGLLSASEATQLGLRITGRPELLPTLSEDNRSTSGVST
jgi:DNA-binding HxlR family transcriptional regulator